MSLPAMNEIRAGRLWLIWGLILCLGFPVLLRAATPDGTFSYRPELGAKSPALDVYTTDGLTAAPVLVYVHGGAWKAGDKKRTHSKPTHFNGLGMVFVSINYRLVPEVSVEEQLLDVDRALGWVRRNIGTFGGDPRNIHLLGHSAGAHLVSMTGVRPLENAGQLIADNSLRSVIANDTRAYDLPRIDAVSRGGRMPRIYKQAFGSDPQRWKDLSPIYQIGRHKPYPAFLVLYSGQGNTAQRRAFAKSFASALSKFGARVSTFDGTALSHAEINKELGKNNPVTRQVDRFLQSQSR